MSDSRLQKAHPLDAIAVTSIRPVARFGLLLLAIGCLVSLGALSLFGSKAWLAIGLSTGLFGLVALLALLAMNARYVSQHLGLCNIVTASRAGLVALLAGVCGQPMLVESHGWLLVMIAVTALAMDGLDGWLARRFEMSSEFGARFDMEVDALLGAVLALLLLISGKAGIEILALGFMRYAFVLAGLALPWLNAPLPERFRRQLICVLQIVALIALLSPIVTGPLAAIISASAVALLSWSFLVDARWLFRHAR